MEQVSPVDPWLRLMDHENFIPVAGMIVAIIAAAVVVIVCAKLWLAHRQRMAMIAQGMHPDGEIEDLDGEARLDSAGARLRS